MESEQEMDDMEVEEKEEKAKAMPKKAGKKRK